MLLAARMHTHKPKLAAHVLKVITVQSAPVKIDSTLMLKTFAEEQGHIYSIITQHLSIIMCMFINYAKEKHIS